MSSPLCAIIKWDIYDRNRFPKAGEALGSVLADSPTAPLHMLGWLSMASLLTHSLLECDLSLFVVHVFSSCAFIQFKRKLMPQEQKKARKIKKWVFGGILYRQQIYYVTYNCRSRIIQCKIPMNTRNLTVIKGVAFSPTNSKWVFEKNPTERGEKYFFIRIYFVVILDNRKCLRDSSEVASLSAVWS